MLIRCVVIMLLVGLAVLSGCATTPSCKLSEGFKCKSLSETYALDGGGATTPHRSEAYEPAIALQASDPIKAEEGQPIFQPPRRIRIWFADWGTRDIYVPNHYIYLRVDEGRWILPEFQWHETVMDADNVQ